MPIGSADPGGPCLDGWTLFAALAAQTPADIVPEYPASEAVGHCPGPACSPNDDHQAQARQEKSIMQTEPRVDARWQQK